MSLIILTLFVTSALAQDVGPPPLGGVKPPPVHRTASETRCRDHPQPDPVQADRCAKLIEEIDKERKARGK